MRGGDIDLYIETRLPREQAFLQEQYLYAALQWELGEQYIDIVTRSEGMMLQPTHEAALRTGVQIPYVPNNEWLGMCRLRIRLVHEYIDSPVDMLEALRQAREFVTELSNTGRILAEYSQHHLQH